MDDLLTDFCEEAREMLEVVEGEIVAWEAAPGDRARLDTIFRFVHTVKGNCGFLDLPRLEALSHAAEGALSDVRAGRRTADKALVDAVLAIIDRISAIVEAMADGQEYPIGGDAALVAALDEKADEAGEAAVPEQAAQPEVTGSETGETQQAAPRTIRLPVAMLDKVLASVSDLVLARNDLSRRVTLENSDPATSGAFERLSTILDDVRDGVGRLRMQRLDNLFNTLPRLVRDLSAELGKQVMIDMEGGDTELDREMIETIRDPFTHIIRNAIDHGFETPSERLADGKREIGLLHIGARQSGNRILIAVTDDGRGIDPAVIGAKACEAGIVDEAALAAMSDADIQELIFHPGLSTAGEVTSISGRGVGMDVVRSNIERVGGSIELTSTPGEGTRLVMSLPLTLSIVSALTVESEGQLFAIPRSYVDEIILEGVRGADTFAEVMGETALVTVRGQRMRRVSLSSSLHGGEDRVSGRGALVLIRQAGGDLFALWVDRVLDHEDMVVKPIAPAIKATGLYAGTVMMDDGTPVLMLDIAGIARQAQLATGIGRRREVPVDHGATAAKKGDSALLFESVDGARRLLRMELVERIERTKATAIRRTDEGNQVVLGDEILPLFGIPDGTVPDGRVVILRLRDGQSTIGYVAREIIDMAMIGAGTVKAGQPGEIEGVILLDGVATEIVDPHWLFSQPASQPAPVRRPRCRVDMADAWNRGILVPLLEGAGYDPVAWDHDGATDLAIVTEQGEVEPAAAVPTIALTSDPSRASDGLYYRYDREGIVDALARAANGGAG